MQLWRKSERDNAAFARKSESNREKLLKRSESEKYLRQMPRHWRLGDVYAPHDLSPEEATKFQSIQPVHHDVCDLLGMNPLDEYRVGCLLGDQQRKTGI